jgi:hypothetical protein
MYKKFVYQVGNNKKVICITVNLVFARSETLAAAVTIPVFWVMMLSLGH